MNQCSVSVIVPVYNAEGYIRRCLDSIAHQTLQDIEIILVDDGSNDKSGFICDEYAHKDSRFKVLHQNNKGVSAARQLGLDKASGKYVIHADPDDWVDSTWLEYLYNCAEKSDVDMAICDYYLDDGKNKVYKKEEPSSLQTDDVAHDILTGKIWGSLWNKLIKRDLFSNYHISFDTSMNLWEDSYVLCHLLRYPIKIKYINKALYYYDYHSNPHSIVRRKNYSQVLSQKKFIDSIEKYYNNPKFEEGIYIRKCKTVERCFDTGKENLRKMRSLFATFNKEYVKRNPFNHNNIKPYCIGLCLRGHCFVAYYLYYFWQSIMSMYRSIKSFFKK